MDNALAVMLRPPKSGSVKTRLVPLLTHEEAAVLYECLIRDTFKSIVTLNGIDIFAACARGTHTRGTHAEHGSGSGEEKIIDGLIPKGVEIFRQEGMDLGHRIHNVFKALFDKGYKKAAIIGSDSPDLPPEYIEEAFGLLSCNGVGLVLGPAIDGGYYLVALDKPNAAIFEGIPWSTDAVLEETIKRATAEAIEFRLLRRWHDIDTPQDLKFLEDNPNAPASSAFIRTIMAYKDIE
ncbi:MAG: TIGR04282 family arsenosugar biosynthesis glycosyltransferase [Deltaproteobacteria bacterium]|nr:TIGR04282 family arsenosugar biosynthesis glycosyltransferase [Deltaproteobacteria bacterium]